METKDFAGRVELKTSPEGRFTARVATFDVPDKTGDIVKRGAFAASIARWQGTGDRVPVVFAHQSDNPAMFIGHVDPTELRETALGLEVSGQIDLADPNGAKVFRQLQARTLREWSYAYLVKQAHRLADGARELLALELLELGPCLVGCGTTATLDVKTAAPDRQAAAPGPLAAHRRRLDLAQRRIAIELALARGR